MKKIKCLVIFTLIILAISGCSSSKDTTQTSSEPTKNPSVAVVETPNNSYTFGETFTFDGFDLTFYNQDLVVNVYENSYSDYNGISYVLIPVTLTNNSGESGQINMFYYKVYGIDGKSQDFMGALIMDNEVLGFGADLRNGASGDYVLPVIYDGAGDYIVEFAMPFGDTIEVILPLS